MPLLDPGAVLASPYLSDDIQIVQRALTVGENGRGTVTPTTSLAWGTVCAASANDLERVPEAATAKRAMSFVLNAQVRPVADANQPDLLVWPVPPNPTSAQWVVLDVQAYPNYGRGWYQVIAASQDVQDVPL